MSCFLLADALPDDAPQLASPLPVVVAESYAMVVVAESTARSRTFMETSP
jgi:hypothetical protein